MPLPPSWLSQSLPLAMPLEAGVRRLQSRTTYRQWPARIAHAPQTHCQRKGSAMWMMTFWRSAAAPPIRSGRTAIRMVGCMCASCRRSRPVPETLRFRPWKRRWLRLPPRRSAELCPGTTVATNALLEGAGAPSALAHQCGLRDQLRIGDQHRDDLFAPRAASAPSWRKRC